MNIFVLDKNPRLAAQAHCDKHLTKMALEGIQMLAVRLNRIYGQQLVKPDGTPFKLTHQNHPCSKWVCESADNARWLLDLVDELLMIRQSKVMRSYWEILNDRLGRCGNYYDHTDFVLCMPDKYKVGPTAVESYRAYYLSKPLSYKNRNWPTWAIPQEKSSTQ